MSLQNISEILNLQQWAEKNYLIVKKSKTKCMLFHKANDNVKDEFSLSCNGNDIERVYTFKYLGIILDSNLNFTDHYMYVKKRVSAAIGALNHIKRYLPFDIFCIFLKA